MALCSGPAVAETSLLLFIQLIKCEVQKSHIYGAVCIQYYTFTVKHIFAHLEHGMILHNKYITLQTLIEHSACIAYSVLYIYRAVHIYCAMLILHYSNAENVMYFNAI